MLMMPTASPRIGNVASTINNNLPVRLLMCDAAAEAIHKKNEPNFWTQTQLTQGVRTWQNTIQKKMCETTTKGSQSRQAWCHHWSELLNDFHRLCKRCYWLWARPEASNASIDRWKLKAQVHTMKDEWYLQMRYLQQMSQFDKQEKSSTTTASTLCSEASNQ